MKIEFTKMQGAGNDYIYVNTLIYPLPNPEELAVAWSRPHTGIGSDGLVLIGSSGKADFSMRIFNADGSEAKMCGNASRCIGKYVYEYGLTRKTEVTIHPVDLGEGYPYREGIAVSMGNPHLVIFVDDMEQVDLPRVGPVLEHHPLFPDRVNVEFAQVLAPGRARMRVWERGSGITMACGTGACATAVASAYTHRCPGESDIIMDGGTLRIRWAGEGTRLFMTGPAEKVFDGVITV